MESRPLTYNVVQAAKQLSLGRNKTLELIHKGELRAIRVGRRLIVPDSSLKAYVETQLANFEYEGSQA